MAQLIICDIGGKASFTRRLRCTCGGSISSKVDYDIFEDGWYNTAKCSGCKRPKPARKLGWKIAPGRERQAHRRCMDVLFQEAERILGGAP